LLKYAKQGINLHVIESELKVRKKFIGGYQWPDGFIRKSQLRAKISLLIASAGPGRADCDSLQILIL
jgi:hypothetical protein